MQQGNGAKFSGLKESDFKTGIDGTSWRSRDFLAGAVARQLSETTALTFVSWAIYGWPVAFLTHRANYRISAFELGKCKAKFTIEVDDDRIYYGFYIERNNGPVDSDWDWTRLLPALMAKPELQQQIADAERAGAFRMIGRTFKGDDHFHYANGLAKGAQSRWPEDGTNDLSVAERLQRLDAVRDDQWIELYLIATLTKAKALAAGVHVADTISATLRQLLPIYTAATGHQR